MYGFVLPIGMGCLLTLIGFVLGVGAGLTHENHFRDLGTLTHVEMLQCESDGGNYIIVKADELTTPIIVYKSGLVLGLKQLHFEYVDTFGCCYELEEVYNED